MPFGHIFLLNILIEALKPPFLEIENEIERRAGRLGRGRFQNLQDFID